MDKNIEDFLKTQILLVAIIGWIKGKGLWEECVKAVDPTGEMTK